MAHFVYNRLEHLGWFRPLGHQHGQTPQGGLICGDAAILGVQRDIVDRLGELPVWKFFGDWEFIDGFTHELPPFAVRSQGTERQLRARFWILGHRDAEM
jgi:hypothetical protein